MELSTFVLDFAACLKIADSKSPNAVNIRTKAAFQPGIGPHSEASTVALVARELQEYSPSRYQGHLALSVPYPDLPRQKCDLCLGTGAKWEWAIEVKMLRLLGDNGKLNDNILMHILSPYPEHRSALTDCAKLIRSTIADSRAIVIYGFDHTDWPLEPAINAFEILARAQYTLGPRHSAGFDHLVHPVHNHGCVYGWQAAAKDANARQPK